MFLVQHCFPLNNPKICRRFYFNWHFHPGLFVWTKYVTNSRKTSVKSLKVYFVALPPYAANVLYLNRHTPLPCCLPRANTDPRKTSPRIAPLPRQRRQRWKEMHTTSARVYFGRHSQTVKPLLCVSFLFSFCLFLFLFIHQFCAEAKRSVDCIKISNYMVEETRAASSLSPAGAIWCCGVQMQSQGEVTFALTLSSLVAVYPQSVKSCFVSLLTTYQRNLMHTYTHTHTLIDSQAHSPTHKHTQTHTHTHAHRLSGTLTHT